MSVTLAAAEYGAGEPVAILHGLFGSGRNWASIAQRLGARHRVVALDLRNHGASPWAAAMDYRALVEDVLVAMRARGHERFALLGHSMGGKAAMTLTLSNPSAVTRLVVVDIAPVAQPIPYLSYVRAMRTLDLSKIERRRDADDALADAIPDAGERGFLLQSLDLTEQPPRWRLNLAAIEAALSALGGFPAFPPGTVYDGPALFVAGGRSHAVRPEDEPAIQAFFPAAEIARIAEAGHWVHAERPAEFLALVEQFLAA